MRFANQATKITLLEWNTPQMRAFHMTWFSFFLCFFAWFGIAPLMPRIREEMNLAPWQVGNLMIASVSATIFARLVVGRLCDRFGPRIVYSLLLCLGSLPVMGVVFAHNYETLFWFRLAIGMIGASFVVTQYHTSIMFAPSCVGTANATAAGWGNLGGGVTQQVTPLLAAAAAAMGASAFWSWRVSMLCVGVVCFCAGVAYYLLTQDAPDGNFKDLRAKGKMPASAASKGSFLAACRDPRVWALFVIYGCCFGIELTIDNIAATYFYDRFGLSDTSAGMIAGLFGMMNLFARALGGYFGDRFGAIAGLRGRTHWLFAVVFCEGLALMMFSWMDSLVLAVPAMLFFGLFVKMSNGATYSVVPFINPKALGSVSGIVGAGGNCGAMAAGLLFRSSTDAWPQSLFLLGIIVSACAFVVLIVRFSEDKTVAAEPLIADTAS